MWKEEGENKEIKETKEEAGMCGVGMDGKGSGERGRAERWKEEGEELVTLTPLP